VLFCFRDPGAEQKFKDISNAYEVGPTGFNSLQNSNLLSLDCTFSKLSYLSM
jgi:hypothetical protein